ncbi:adenylosuccinate synthase [Halogeometricum borinquense]|uniref:Adenylosuccinate synthetase n=2 Tax=Halogeometricum borinquense TaxID=60847 RepID=E4NPK5_HALBP|nr:adenylosuccinate synthase [Halogeometricum borinquense]ADQ67675.1 Adenylosuccinate synthetase [Halogeometricum borinquense DSM 11551]ELY23644.1 adenylosuccinate synthetase [Halogeometricum borinquense DSM 11551]QIB73736.1 adenylosuccinate synthase [Halogeometricum borinquense]QIQ76906.1 adenylosuccinate synthase [Halogeometricum borinquense]RYJ13379.1 adenylosuccinate synthase [Halogeometricum borinquense]
MTVTIVGSQLGDEGKGALVDLWGGDADVVARYQGGDNAGHTVVEDGDEYKLSLVPSGAVRGKIGILGNGCVINPKTLFSEIDELRERGLDPDVRLAERAHVIMPYHRRLDNIEEEAKADSELTVGTTGRGIGPTYEDKAGRRGIRVGDLLDPEVLRQRLEYVVPKKRALIENVYGLEAGEECDVEKLFEQYAEYGRRLESENMTVNCGNFLAERRSAGENVMFEGAQGTLIDIDHGSYPYVTSSNPTAGGAATGTGVGPTVVGQGEVVGIVKAYLSRVGEGPMPTELKNDEHQEELADYIREKGGEFGTVTGRPRRIGWLDIPMLRHSARVSGLTGLAVNHLDVLAGLDEVKVGHSYTLDGEEYLTMPATTERWAQCEPNLREFETWDDVDWTEVAAEGYDAIPAAAQDYLEYISEEVGAPIYAVGVGPDRAETVEVVNPFEQ